MEVTESDTCGVVRDKEVGTQVMRLGREREDTKLKRVLDGFCKAIHTCFFFIQNTFLRTKF